MSDHQKTVDGQKKELLLVQGAHVEQNAIITKSYDYYIIIIFVCIHFHLLHLIIAWKEWPQTIRPDPRSALIGKRRRDKGKVAITLPHGWQPLSRLNPPRYDCFCDLKLVQYIQIVLVYILLFSLISPQWQYVEFSISFHV